MKNQKRLALALLEWHGGQSSALYAVGSCMLSDSERGKVYSPANHRGHDIAARRAVSELRDLKKDANFPEAVTLRDQTACNNLATQLEKYL